MTSNTKVLESLKKRHGTILRELRSYVQREADGGTLSAADQAALSRLDAEALRIGQQAQEEIRRVTAENEMAEALEDTYRRATGHGYLPDGAARSTLRMPSRTEYRALSEGSDSAGGYVVPELWSAEVAQYFAANVVVLKAGPRVLTMTAQQGDTVFVPKVSAGTTVQMLAEAAQITAADLTLDRITLKPKKATGLTIVSNEALQDSRPELREIVANDHVAQVGRLLDAEMLAGSGSAPHMRGLRNVTVRGEGG